MSDSAAATTSGGSKSLQLMKVLGPVHVWALGVGIVLVGEYMGWNFSVGKGGAMGSLLAAWFIGLLYTCVAMIDSEVTSTVASAGGQYAQAKHIIGPLMAFNVGLFLVLEYTMLEAADALVIGDLFHQGAAQFGYAMLDPKPFVVLCIASLAWLNYRGIFMTLTFNFVITFVAFVAIVVLFFGLKPWNPTELMYHKELWASSTAGGLPYGWIGVLAAFQFGIWYYLGIEGTCQSAEETRSTGRALPLGTLTGVITLLIAAILTWYVASGLLPWEYLGQSAVPLYDTATETGSHFLEVLLFVGTLFSCLASANGTITDAARSWFAMARDRYLPVWFGAVHPRFRTPYRAIVFLVPVAISFGFTGLLDQVITFSILSGLLVYTFMAFNVVKFRWQWPVGTIRRPYTHPFHPFPAITLFVLCVATYFSCFLGYGDELLAMMSFYIVVSLWFHFYRYKYVRRADQFTMPWPRPRFVKWTESPGVAVESKHV